MKRRYLEGPIPDFCLTELKMGFVSGLRQCGKTTLALMLLRKRTVRAYHNWDDVEFRRLWAKHPSAIIPPHHARDVPLVVLDEIHKDRRWKRNLKGVFDTLAFPCNILVTGSARLGLYMRGSDSLLGRYFASDCIPFRCGRSTIPKAPARTKRLPGSSLVRAEPAGQTVTGSNG